MRVAVSIVLFLVSMRLGWGILRALGRPVPAPPPPGELRRVNVRYRCGVCGAEARMTRAGNEDPEPPRHCMEDMDVVATE